MATLTEQQTLYTDATLKNKVAAACVNAAWAIQTEAANTANHTARLAWAKATFLDSAAAAAAVLPVVVAANAASTSAQITGATDVAIQTAVNNAVNAFLS